jgi:hypothetical protein
MSLCVVKRPPVRVIIIPRLDSPFPVCMMQSALAGVVCQVYMASAEGSLCLLPIMKF